MTVKQVNIYLVLILFERYLFIFYFFLDGGGWGGDGYFFFQSVYYETEFSSEHGGAPTL